MRILLKYKNLSFLKISSYKLRLLKFKRTKWKKTLFFYNYLSLKNCFINHRTILVKLNSWDRLSLQYKNFMLLKKMYRVRYDGLKTFKFNNRILNGKQQNIFRMDYKLEVVLYKLGFCSSIYESQNLIKNKKVVLNDCIFSDLTRKLKKGDIIRILQKLKYNDSLFTFNIYSNILEIDFYNQTFIVLKEFEDLKYSDLSLMFFENYYKLV